MKDSAILKGELSIFTQDRSAVIQELRQTTKELKKLKAEVLQEESKRDTLARKNKEEQEELRNLKDEKESVRKELVTLSQDFRNLNAAIEAAQVKQSQQIKLHLGRIKELKEEEAEVTKELAKLRKLYDEHSDVYGRNLSDMSAKVRVLDEEIKNKFIYLTELNNEIIFSEAEEKKLTKERLKREDKLRVRERKASIQEKILEKKEEDMRVMANDMSIVYDRLKELYAKHFPDINLDKIVMQAV